MDQVLNPNIYAQCQCHGGGGGEFALCKYFLVPQFSPKTMANVLKFDDFSIKMAKNIKLLHAACTYFHFFTPLKFSLPPCPPQKKLMLIPPHLYITPCCIICRQIHTGYCPVPSGRSCSWRNTHWWCQHWGDWTAWPPLKNCYYTTRPSAVYWKCQVSQTTPFEVHTPPGVDLQNNSYRGSENSK